MRVMSRTAHECVVHMCPCIHLTRKHVRKGSLNRGLLLFLYIINSFHVPLDLNTISVEGKTGGENKTITKEFLRIVQVAISSIEE